MHLFQRLRGVLGSTVIWALTWMVLSLPFSMWQLASIALPWEAWPRTLARQSYLWGLSGAGAGAAFGLLMLLSERRQSIFTLSPVRVALWGAIGSMALPAAVRLAGHGLAAFTEVSLLSTVTAFGVCALLGAASGAAAVRIAQRAEHNAVPDRSTLTLLPPTP